MRTTVEQPGDEGPHYLLMGGAATFLVLLLVFGFSALFTPATYDGWVAFTGISSVPALLVCGLVWHYRCPAAFAALDQPARGAAYLGLTALLTLAGGAFLYYGPGHGAGPTPMLINCAILSIVTAFWIIVAWQCWPLSLVFKSPIALGLAAWAASYLLAWGGFSLFFNFAEARHAPFYRPALDPGGLFDSWHALVFAVTSSAVLVVLEKLFAYWPFQAWAEGRAPVRFGLGMSVLALLVTAAVMVLCLDVFHVEIVALMLWGPVAVIFGCFFVTNLTQSRIFAGLPQPRRGLCLLATALVAGIGMEAVYRRIASLVAGTRLLPGPPHHGLELWVATALLGLTFPLIVVLTGYFDFWPLRRRPPQ